MTTFVIKRKVLVLSWSVAVSAYSGCHNKAPLPARLKHQQFTSRSSGVWESQVRAPARLIPGEDSSLLADGSLLSVLGWPFLGACVSADGTSFSSCKGTSPLSPFHRP